MMVTHINRKVFLQINEISLLAEWSEVYW